MRIYKYMYFWQNVYFFSKFCKICFCKVYNFSVHRPAEKLHFLIYPRATNHDVNSMMHIIYWPLIVICHNFICTLTSPPPTFSSYYLYMHEKLKWICDILFSTWRVPCVTYSANYDRYVGRTRTTASPG